MSTEYVGSKTASMRVGPRDSIQLLWGDRCKVLRRQGGRAEVDARGRTGWVDEQDLGGSRLLELYVIDVGQGDGVLIQTPDGKWHLIDAGVPNEAQDIGKGAPNFIRWKFIDDLQKSRVELENVFISHSDFDHYGGLINLLAGELPAYGTRPARTFGVQVENLYHNGMARFAASPELGATTPGTVAPFPFPSRGLKLEDDFITELLSGKTSFSSPPRALRTRPRFDDLAQLVGSVPARVQRLCSDDLHVPGYEPGQNAVQMRVLGPVLERFGSGRRGLRSLASASKTRNGHSIVLRLDYGNARILLTGDLNSESQRLLLSYHSELEFACDVAKACHHGSADVDMEFLRAMSARATISSSGDNESYAHPRPRVLGGSAMYGREAVDERGRRVPPLLYSTELARSVELHYAKAVEVDYHDGTTQWVLEPDRGDVRLRAEGDASSDPLHPLGTTPVAVDMVFGLVNVRTDGEQILFATMHESGDRFDVERIRAGVSPTG